ncbi:hypothetical protein [Streptomyces iconiensis]|uniref:Uncharacterized protein n=1 Tax=Streptomyces iconiensis TaxID=1384038 RepID=A0ABT6ZZV6_9ACTN|nr:hypothetical protein [Streptomyces iconiensis]MDJ1134605.1 hypothetical protein [Streptomyces iconiensis]
MSVVNSRIATACFVGGKFVKNHSERVFTTLHASSRSEANALWLGTAHATEGGTRHDV